MKYLKYLLILWFSILTLSYAGTIDPSTPDSKYIEYGQKFTYVLKMSGKDKHSKIFEASAVAIDDHHILTAAHVVKDCTDCYVIIEDKKYPIETVTINKNFDTEFGVGDIAIGYSSKSFNMDFYPKLFTKKTEEDQVCSISGFGLTGTFNTGSIKSDGKRRAGSNIVDRIYKDMLICNPSYRTSGKFTELEFLIASGDSGGGLFIDGKLAGINSCVMASHRSPNSEYNEEAGHTRISNFIQWIEDNKTK